MFRAGDCYEFDLYVDHNRELLLVYGRRLVGIRDNGKVLAGQVVIANSRQSVDRGLVDAKETPSCYRTKVRIPLASLQMARQPAVRCSSRA